MDLPTPDDFQRIPLRMTEPETAIYTRQGWKYLPLTVLSGEDAYKKHWTEWFAIREFVQNSMDEVGSFKLLYDDVSHISYIRDQGKGIDIKDMYFGEQKGKTPREVHCLRGVFGEGMKLSLLTLLQQGKRVIIQTVETDFHFSIVEEISKRKGQYTHIGVFSRPNQIEKGTTVAIQGVNCLAYAKFFAPTIAEVSPEKIIVSVQGGEGEFDDCKTRQVYDIPGMIYLRDIFVESLNSLFGYNFWFNSTKEVLGSDRVELRDMWVAVPELTILINNGNPEFLRELVKRLFLPVYRRVDEEDKPLEFKVKESLEWRCLSDPKLQQGAATSLHLAIFDHVKNDFSWSENLVEQKALEHAGILDLRDKFPSLRNVFVKYGLVRDPKDIIKASELSDETIVFTASDILTSDFGDLEERKELAESFREITSEVDCILREFRSAEGTCRGTQIKFYIGQYKNEESVAGFYSSKADEVYIRMSNLKSTKDLLRVLIHELAHAHCHTQRSYDREKSCGDLSQGFEDALAQVATTIIDEIILDGSCDLDRMRQAIKNIDRNFDRLLEEIIQHKLQIVNNPKGLVRPKHYDQRDKEAIDATFVRIAKNCYRTASDINAILDGYDPISRRYQLGYHSRQLASGSTLATAQKDQQIIKKLEITIPIGLQKLTSENLDDWTTWVSGDCPTSPTNNINFLYEGEDPRNYRAAYKFFKDHPDPRVKRRNFSALRYGFINPWARYQDLESEDAARAAYQLGSRADPQMLQDVIYAALKVMDEDKDLYPCLSWSGQSSWGMLKEDIIKLASLPEAANQGWRMILTKGEASAHSDNRRYTAYGYKELEIHATKSGHPRTDPTFDLSLMLGKETDPQVLTEILACILEVLELRSYGLSYLAKEQPEAFAKFSKIIREHYQHISEVVAQIPKSDEFLGKPIRAILEVVGRTELEHS